MSSLRKRGRIWYYRFTDADGIKRETKGCTDKRVTEELARAAEGRAAKIRDGVLLPEEEAIAAAARRPILEDLDDFHAAELAKGNDPGNARTDRLYAGRVLELGGVTASPS